MGRWRAEDGAMIVEVMAAVLILAVGVSGALMTFVTSQKLSVVSERQSTMSHVAQREIERIEGIPYAEIGLMATPTGSTDSKNPDYWVGAGSPPSFGWDRSSSSTEPLDVDTTNGQIPLTQTWTEGNLSGTIYDFISWDTDSACAPGCPSSADYKRITVAVTMSGELNPVVVWVSSVISDPNATPAQGVVNGTAGNPVAAAGTTCYSQTQSTTTSCESPIDSGNPNTYYLHDCPGTSASCPAPSANGVLHDTVGAVSGLLCSTNALTGLLASLVTGCPTPDEMDSSPPSGTSTSPLYQYSTDLGTGGYVGGRLLQPLCSNSTGCGSGSPSDCSSGAPWSKALINAQNEMWVSAPVATNTKLTGDGGINLFTQTQNALSAVVTFCIAIYSVPPSDGVAGSLADLLDWPPTQLGGTVAYVSPTDPGTGSNWPTSPSNLSFTFNFASSGVTLSAGNRLGVRVWIAAKANTSIALMYDNPSYPSEIQLNTQ